MTPRMRLLAVVAGALAVLVAATQLRARSRALEDAAAAARREADEVSRLAARHAALAEEVKRLEAGLGGAAAPLLAYAGDQGRAVGLGTSLKSVAAAGTAEAGEFVEETVEVEVSGLDLARLVAFLDRLEGDRADVVVRALYLRPTPGAPDLLDASIVVAAVRPR